MEKDEMSKFNRGDVAMHRSTNEKLLILFVRETMKDISTGEPVQKYMVRTPDYKSVEVDEFELEVLDKPENFKIKD
jgi:hypothetical protein